MSAQPAPVHIDRPWELLSYLLRQYDNVVLVQEQIVMDTEEDRRLHDEAVSTFKRAAEPVRLALAAHEQDDDSRDRVRTTLEPGDHVLSVEEVRHQGVAHPEFGTEGYRRYAALFNDITRAPLPITEWVPLSDRQAVADYLWEQGWRREVRPEDVTR